MGPGWRKWPCRGRPASNNAGGRSPSACSSPVTAAAPPAGQPRAQALPARTHRSCHHCSSQTTHRCPVQPLFARRPGLLPARPSWPARAAQATCSLMAGRMMGRRRCWRTRWPGLHRNMDAGAGRADARAPRCRARARAPARAKGHARGAADSTAAGLTGRALRCRQGRRWVPLPRAAASNPALSAPRHPGRAHCAQPSPGRGGHRPCSRPGAAAVLPWRAGVLRGIAQGSWLMMPPHPFSPEPRPSG